MLNFTNGKGAICVCMYVASYKSIKHMQCSDVRRADTYVQYKSKITFRKYSCDKICTIARQNLCGDYTHIAQASPGNA